MANYYCKYCGVKFSSVSGLSGSLCPKHPYGNGKGKHKLYEGCEKSQYICKHCGNKFSSISGMTGSLCYKYPLGANKGRHEPAL